MSKAQVNWLDMALGWWSIGSFTFKWRQVNLVTTWKKSRMSLLKGKASLLNDLFKVKHQVKRSEGSMLSCEAQCPYYQMDKQSHPICLVTLSEFLLWWVTFRSSSSRDWSSVLFRSVYLILESLLGSSDFTDFQRQTPNDMFGLWGTIQLRCCSHIKNSIHCYNHGLTGKRLVLGIG